MNENIFDSFEIIDRTASTTEGGAVQTFGNIFDLSRLLFNYSGYDTQETAKTMLLC